MPVRDVAVKAHVALAALRAATDDVLADELRRRGWVAYRKRPSMRRGKVRLRDGTVLVQTTVEEFTSDGT